MSEEGAPNPYDLVPYQSQAFAQTHPDRLATIAHIFGLRAPPVESCRVLELGCASGGNLIPMACGLLGSTFVGVDLSGVQVAQAREHIEKLGLRNVRIEHASIMDIDTTWGTFDYLICHGVYSWVEPAVQDRILELAARLLGDDGIAYVSYNTYPGWHMRESVRHMMRYHANGFVAPTERVAQARALMDFLSQGVRPESGAYGQMLSTELDLLRRSHDWYLHHEHLEAVNTPLYFHQFVEHAERFGLQYLGEAEFATMLARRFAPAVTETLERISGDVVQLEQYMDFVGNRYFRQTLLCKRGRVMQRALSPAVMHGLHVACAVDAESARAIDLRSGVDMTFDIAGRSRVTTSQPVVKAAFVLLAERWPASLPVETLCELALARAAGVDQSKAGPASQRAALMGDLFQCLLSGAIEVRSAAPPCVGHLSERPRASAWSLLQASTQAVVTNVRHDVIVLEPLGRTLLALLDGTRTREQLGEQVGRLLQEGRVALPLDTAGRPVPSLVAECVAACLSKLMRSGLLIA